MSARTGDLERAIWLSYASILWSLIIGIAAIWAALSSGALALLGFGVNALIDATASVALAWRFKIEVRAPLRATRVERSAEAVVGAALATLGLYLVVGSMQALAAGTHPSLSPIGIAILAGSLAVQPPLALLKRRLSIKLRSGALRADSTLTAVGALLALLSLLGLVAAASFGFGFADAVAALAVGLIVLREGSASLWLSRQRL